MFPRLHLGPFVLPMYALMVIAGIIAFAFYYVYNVEKRDRIDKTTSNRLLFSSVLGFFALVVSAFVFNSFFHSIEEGKLVIGGITWLGGVIGVIPSMYFLIHHIVPKEKGNAINRFSTMIPGLVIAHALGRVGCFCGGCCYGEPTNSIFGVVFPPKSLAGNQYPDYNSEPIKEIIKLASGEEVERLFYSSVPVLPTQLIEAIFEIILFVLMLVLYKKLRNYNVEFYCFAYGAFRFTLEFWRGDERGATGLLLSPSQLMSIILWIFAILLILYRNGIIFKKLSAKAENWRIEAENTPADAPIFKGKSTRKSADTLRELYKLYTEGVITKEDYNQRKKEVLDSMCLVSDKKDSGGAAD